MPKFDWHPEVEDDILAIGRIVDSSIDTDVARIREIAAYATQPGGKMIRPGLAMTVYRALDGGDVSKMRKFASAVELLHTGSLIHDDISDESETRRGRKAVHVKFGHRDALLAGDYVMSRAFAMATETQPAIVSEVLKTGASLAEGEVLQRQWCNSRRLISYSDRMRLTDLKTASLFALLSWSACMGTDYEKTLEGRAFSLGLNLGRAFQLHDDMLDLEGDEAKTGKPLMNDLAQGNLTFPVIYALEHLEGARLRELRTMIRNPKRLKLARFRSLVSEGGGKDYLRRRIEHFQSLCLDAVGAFPRNPFSASLGDLIRFSSTRGG